MWTLSKVVEKVKELFCYSFQDIAAARSERLRTRARVQLR